MMEIKKFIDVHVPIFYCNLKCNYCYVGQCSQNVIPCKFQYSSEVVKRALSVERLGGVCHFNVCGMGETMIPRELIEYIRVILEDGHTVMIVTNGTLTERFLEYMQLPQKLKNHLGFKFSYHYLELLRLNLMDVFWNNVRLVRDNGCSFSVELTPNDSYELYIEDIKKSCIENVGAKCHLSVPRNEASGGIELYSKHSKEEFYNIWKDFDSPMFELKMRHWEERRKEFCYAGLWSGLLNLGTGEFNACYRQPGPLGNMFENIDEKFPFCPVGKCALPHCFNGHSFLAWGIRPEIAEESYLDIRDRKSKMGSWINSEMAEQFEQKLYENNEQLSDEEKKKYLKIHKRAKIKYDIQKVENKVHKVIGKVRGKV